MRISPDLRLGLGPVSGVSGTRWKSWAKPFKMISPFSVLLVLSIHSASWVRQETKNWKNRCRGMKTKQGFHIFMIVSRLLLFYFVRGVVGEWCWRCHEWVKEELSAKWGEGMARETSLAVGSCMLRLFHAMKLLQKINCKKTLKIILRAAAKWSNSMSLEIAVHTFKAH